MESNIASEKARIEQAAKDAGATTAKTAKDTASAIGNAQNRFEADLQRRVEAARAAAAANSQGALDRLLGAPSAGLASADDLSLLGIDQNQYDRLVGGLKGGYVDPKGLGATVRDASGINQGNVASAEDYARYNVLKRLAGGGDFLGDDASQAVTYNKDLLDFNFSEPVIPQYTPPAAADIPVVPPVQVGGTDIMPPTSEAKWDGKKLRTDFDPNDHTDNPIIGGTVAPIPNQALNQPVQNPYQSIISQGGGVWDGKKLNTGLQSNNQSNFPLLNGFSFY